MGVDYKELCIRLFGTADVDELTKLSEKLKSNRNAGRKKKLSEDDIKNIHILLEKGETINVIAEKYGTTRQMISKYVNMPPTDNYTMRITYMYRQFPCTTIDVDFLDKKISIQNKTDDIFHRAFGIIEHPTWEDFEDFLKYRCVPETRNNIKNILQNLDIDSYDPLQIVEKTQGRLTDDDMWLKFKYFKRGGPINEDG